MLILTGLVTFVIAEKLFTVIEKIADDKKQQTKESLVNNNTKGITPENKTNIVSIWSDAKNVYIDMLKYLCFVVKVNHIYS